MPTEKQYTGMIWRFTPGHGYLEISQDWYQEMVEEFPMLLEPNRFYHEGMTSFEEDQEWARVAVAFPFAFSLRHVKCAVTIAKNAWPEAYEKITRRVIPVEKSLKKRRAIFIEKNKENYVVVSAYGSWHEDCPSGWVLVHTVKGGRKANGQYASDDHAYFLVESDIYHVRHDNPENEFGFVITDDNAIPFVKETDVTSDQRNSQPNSQIVLPGIQ